MPEANHATPAEPVDLDLLEELLKRTGLGTSTHHRLIAELRASRQREANVRFGIEYAASMASGIEQVQDYLVRLLKNTSRKVSP